MKDHKIVYDHPSEPEGNQRRAHAIRELERIGTMEKVLTVLEKRDKEGAQRVLDKYELSRSKSHPDKVDGTKSLMDYEELIGALVFISNL